MDEVQVSKVSQKQVAANRSGRAATAGMAGNAMHAECVGIALLFVLSRGALSFQTVSQDPSGKALVKAGARKRDHLNPALRALGHWINGSPGPRRSK